MRARSRTGYLVVVFGALLAAAVCTYLVLRSRAAQPLSRTAKERPLQDPSPRLGDSSSEQVSTDSAIIVTVTDAKHKAMNATAVVTPVPTNTDLAATPMVIPVENGRLEQQVPSGEYLVSVTAPGYLSAFTRVNVQGGRREVPFVLGLDGFVLKGVVKDSSAGAIRDAEVVVQPVSAGSTLFATRTDDQGKFELRLRSGRYGVDVRSEGYATGGEVLELFADVSRTYALVPAATVAGKVVGPDGSPVPEAQVTVSPRAGVAMPSVMTGADGTFAVRGLRAGDYTVTGRSGKLIGQTDTSVYVAGAADVRVEMHEGGSISGRVASITGAPLSGVRIRVQNGSVGPAAFLGSRLAATTGADGTYRVEGLPSGDFSLMFESTEYVPYTATGQTVGGEQHLDVKLHAGGRIRGLVVSEGVPLAGVDVAAHGADARGYPTYARTSTTGTNGRFFFEGIPSGILSLVAAELSTGRTKFGSLRTSESDDREVIFTLDPVRHVRGRVVDVDGNAIPGARVRGVRLGDGQAGAPPAAAIAVTVSADDGTFDLGPLSPGPAGLSVAIGSVAPTTVTKKVEIPGDSDLDGITIVARRPSEMIKGFVSSSKGEAISGLELGVISASEKLDPGSVKVAGTTGPDGSFAIGPVVPGEYRVWVRSEAGNLQWSGSASAGSELVRINLAR